MISKLQNAAEMIRLGAPRVIRNDRELAEYTEALFKLTSKASLTAHEERAIELLTLLIEHYEASSYPIPDADSVEVLRFLLERNGLAQRDISEDLGGESTVSLVLSGKRQLNRDHIQKLSSRFGVSPAVFFGERMNLDKAIEEVLLTKKQHTATTREISEEIRQRGLYLRPSDGAYAKASQINARIRHHADRFEFVGPGRVRLIRKTGSRSNKAA